MKSFIRGINNSSFAWYNESMMTFFRKYLPEIILTLFVVSYSIYFALLTINRYEKLYAHYYDLGIMHQSVYNTYQALKTGNFSRFLEMTNPHNNSASQIKRMSIHNDILLAAFVPFYFIHEGPETLLFIQAIVAAMGAVFIYLIAKKVLKDLPFSVWLSVIIAASYLLYPPLEKANKFEFHPVTLTSTLLLGMFYYFLEKKYKTSLVYVVLSIFSKEEVGMTTAVFGAYVFFEQYKHHPVVFTRRHLQTFIANVVKTIKNDQNVRYGSIVIAISIIWILLSMFVIIPAARGGAHFASQYYDHIKERPWLIFTYPFKESNIDYFLSLFGPVGFLSLLSPIQLLIALPEFAINLLSNNTNMRNTYFHYNSVITPFIFISTIYSVNKLFSLFSTKMKHIQKQKFVVLIGTYIACMAVLFSYLESPLPYARAKDIFPWLPPQSKYYDVMIWKKILADDNIKVSTTGTLAPHFTSRRYFYDFSWKYQNAEYIVIEKHDVLYGFLKDQSIPAYKELQYDKKYIKIYDEDGIEVYKKVSS